MRNTTIKIEDKAELIGFLRSIGTECRFITVSTETVMDMNMARNTGKKVKSPKTGKLINEKEPNPYYGTVKVARRNGFVNAEWVKMVEKRYAEATGIPVDEVTYTAGSTWYQHCQTEDDKPLCLCEHQKDASRKYLQMFPLRNLGETTYILNGNQLTKEQVSDMYENWVPEDENPEWKPRCIVLAIDSIRMITFRKVNLLNETFSRIATTMAKYKQTRVSTRPAPMVVQEAAMEQ
jgi:hypothetical protein